MATKKKVAEVTNKEDAARKPTKGQEGPPKAQGRSIDPASAIAEASLDVDDRSPGKLTYLDALSRALTEYQAYHETLLKYSVDGKDAQNALVEFDAEVEKIQKAGAERRKRRREMASQKNEPPKKDNEAEEPEVQKRCGLPKDSEKNPPPPIYPEACHPENVWLEFAPKEADYHAQGAAWSDTSNKFSGFTTGNRKLHPPGWLIDLSAPQIKSAHSVKEYFAALKPTDDITKAVDDLHSSVQGLGVAGITKPEITRAIRWLPAGKDSALDFRVFLLALGDFGYASITHATRPHPRKLKCRKDQSDADLNKSSQLDKEVKALFEQDPNDFDSFFEMNAKAAPKLTEERPPYPIRSKEEYVPAQERQAMAEWRQRVIAQKEKQLKEQAKWAEGVQAERMRTINKYRDTYNKQVQEKKTKESEAKKRKEEEEQKKMATKKRMTDKYISEGIPALTAEKKAAAYVQRLEHEADEKARIQDTNSYTPRQQTLWTALFLVEMYEALDVVQKLAASSRVPHKVAPRNEELFKAWCQDKIEQEASAISPYLAPLPFVNNRIVRKAPKTCFLGPNKCGTMGKTTVEFDHWIMDIPPEGNGRILVTENRHRIRQILDYAFFKAGSASCLLPRVELMLHFAHNLADQMLGRPDVEAGGCGDKKETKGAMTPGSSTKNPEAKSKGGKDAANDPNGSGQADRVPTPYRNPARDVSPLGCHAQAQLPIREICKGRKYQFPDLPERFDGAELSWVRKFGASLFRAANPKHQRPKEYRLPLRRLRSLRQSIASFHAKEWDAYNCRRYQFRKALWENLKVENYENDILRNRFANAFWALMPHDNRLPHSLVSTNIETKLI